MAAILGLLIALGVAARLIIAVLTAVLPEPLAQALGSGWAVFYGAIAPAVPALAGIAILAGIGWVIVGSHRR